MESRLKPWKVGSQKTRSQDKRLPENGFAVRETCRLSHTGHRVRITSQPFWRRAGAVVVLCSWLLSILACSQNYRGIPPTFTPASLEVLRSAATQSVALEPEQPSPLPPTDTPLPPPTAAPTPSPTAAPVQRETREAPVLYYTQAGDTLAAVAARFNVLPEEVASPQAIPQEGLFDPGVLLLIPKRLGETSSNVPLLPDSEVVYSPSAVQFDYTAFVQEAGGYLSTYKEWRSTGWFTGAGTIRRVAIENSINPRLLLVILEQQSGWVYDQPKTLAQTDYPMGWLRGEKDQKGLYFQLAWAVQQLNIGYYWWREGRLTDLVFPDGARLRLHPELNAGTVAVLYLFAQLYNQPQWAGILYGPDGMMQLYDRMMGNPWLRAQAVEPLFPATLTQPRIELPFPPGQTWSLTGGPHSAWGADGARAALDFAPSTVTHGCYESKDWVVAGAAGLVVRSENYLVVVDLDGDGYEQTGWSILFMHIPDKDRVPLGQWVNVNDHIGHPSCEGGVATGTHVHIARKYNGEWILADGPMPFVLSGWRAHADPELYHGWMTKDDQTVYSSLVGSFESRVTRPK